MRRSLELNAGQEIYNQKTWKCLHSIENARNGVVLTGDNFGLLRAVDARQGAAAIVHKVHKKDKVTCISANPMATHKFVTCGNDHHMSVWDLRKMSPMPLDDYLHPRVVNSAYYSPVRVRGARASVHARGKHPRPQRDAAPRHATPC